MLIVFIVLNYIDQLSVITISLVHSTSTKSVGLYWSTNRLTISLVYSTSTNGLNLNKNSIERESESDNIWCTRDLEKSLKPCIRVTLCLNRTRIHVLDKWIRELCVNFPRVSKSATWFAIRPPWIDGELCDLVVNCCSTIGPINWLLKVRGLK